MSSNLHGAPLDGLKSWTARWCARTYRALYVVRGSGVEVQYSLLRAAHSLVQQRYGFCFFIIVILPRATSQEASFCRIGFVSFAISDGFFLGNGGLEPSHLAMHNTRNTRDTPTPI